MLKMKVCRGAAVLFRNRRFFVTALLFLGLLNLFGCDVTTDDTVERLRTEAENGDVNAQFNMGVCLVNGDGCKPNPKQAVKWFRLAAEQEDAEAKGLLGVCLIGSVLFITKKK